MNTNKKKRARWNWKLTAWVHPDMGGDDYLIEYEFEIKPTKEEIKKLLRKHSSAATNDYRLEPIC